MSGDHIRVAHVRDSATLTIDAARVSDAGEYICRASNKLGDVETRTIVFTGPENGSIPWICSCAVKLSIVATGQWRTEGGGGSESPRAALPNGVTLPKGGRQKEET